MSMQRPLRALVLSGGGAKGAFEAGIVYALIKEYHEVFDIICGTSIGAINAAFIAQNDIDGLADLWHSIAAEQLIEPYPKVTTLQHLLTVIRIAGHRRGLARMLGYVEELVAVFEALAKLWPLPKLARLTGALDPDHIKTLLSSRLKLETVRRVLIATATDLTTRLPTAFYIFPHPYEARAAAFEQKEPQAFPFSSERFSDEIRASAAIPGAFEPVVTEAASQLRAFVDGGVANNTPIGQAIDAGATEVTVIYLDVEEHTTAEPVHTDSLPAILYGCYTVMQQRLLALDYAMALRTNQTLEAIEKSKHTVKLRKFVPTTPLTIGVLDFSNQELVDACFEQGCGAARNDEFRLRYVE